MDMMNELLEGLPAYKGGKMSVSLYNAGGGLYDERNVEDIPLPVADGAEMSRDAFQAVVNDLLTKYSGRTEKCAEGAASAKVFYNNRILQLRHKDGKITAFYMDEYEPMKEDKSSYLRAVIKTKREEYLAYIDVLKAEGFEVIFENGMEENCYRELKKGDRLIYAYYTAGDCTARFIDDKVSCLITEFGYSTENIPGAAEVYQYALRQDSRVDGFVTDCGMNYIIKLSDNALFFVDGGEYEQATDEAVENLFHFMRELTGAKEGEKIRIACWFCTHAHDDHLDMFSKLLRVHHSEMELERVMYNFPSPEFYRIAPQVYSAINRIKKYYPEVKYLKPHAGQFFDLAGARFEIIQTHEDFTAYGCNEAPDDFNDTSTVLKVTFDGTVFLMLGDVNKIGEAQLLKHFTDKTLKADMVQAAHHLFNKLYYIYDVSDPEYILVPTRPAARTNHDRPHYLRLILSRPEENVFFSSEDGTDGFAVRDGKLTHIYHDILRGGDYDGSDL